MTRACSVVFSMDLAVDLRRSARYDERDWRNRAACADRDTNLWFPIGTTGPALEQLAEAKAVCAACAVREECLVFAVTTNQEYGIWGGLTEDERRDVRRTWRRQMRARRSS